MKTKTKIQEIEKNDIDCYRATDNGCIVYLKNGNQISTKLSFSEIDSIFNCL